VIQSLGFPRLIALVVILFVLIFRAPRGMSVPAMKQGYAPAVLVAVIAFAAAWIPSASTSALSSTRRWR